MVLSASERYNGATTGYKVAARWTATRRGSVRALKTALAVRDGPEKSEYPTLCYTGFPFTPGVVPKSPNTTATSSPGVTGPTGSPQKGGFDWATGKPIDVPVHWALAGLGTDDQEEEDSSQAAEVRCSVCKELKTWANFDGSQPSEKPQLHHLPLHQPRLHRVSMHRIPHNQQQLHQPQSTASRQQRHSFHSGQLHLPTCTACSFSRRGHLKKATRGAAWNRFAQRNQLASGRLRPW